MTSVSMTPAIPPVFLNSSARPEAVGVFRVETARVRSNDKETPAAKSAVRPFIYRSGLRFSQFFSLVLRTVFYGYERLIQSSRLSRAESLRAPAFGFLRPRSAGPR